MAIYNSLGEAWSKNSAAEVVEYIGLRVEGGLLCEACLRLMLLRRAVTLSH